MELIEDIAVRASYPRMAAGENPATAEMLAAAPRGIAVHTRLA